MVSHNYLTMEKIEQKPVFATHSEADAHVQQIKQKHEEQKEESRRDMRETIGEAVEREVFETTGGAIKSSHTIQWKPGQYEQIFRRSTTA